VEALVPDPTLPAGAIAETSEGALRLVRFGAGRRDDAAQAWFELLAARGPYALVHAVYASETGFPAAHAARYLNIPCLLAARGNDLDRDAFRADRQAALLAAIGWADAVVGVSEDLARRARALGARRALAIPNGVSTARFRPMARDPGLAFALRVADAAPLLAFVGEARPKKGLATMLEALRRLLPAHPHARLWLVGGVREDGRSTLAAFSAAHPDAAHAVLVQPPVDPDDLPALLALADLCWHPSDRDGLPNALLEAMACGRATIGARAGGIPDVLDHGELAGLLIPPGDPGALAGLTEALLADPARLRELEAAGRARVEAAFTPAAEVAAYLGLYGELLAGR
jgi:glycosyltransferase involved in cell wall biosynthesis